MTQLTFVGAGNMAASIIGGLIQQGFAANEITACDPNDAALSHLNTEFGIQTQTDNVAVCQSADVVVLAVKPQVMKAVCTSISPALSHQPMVISIAAGITLTQLDQWLGHQLPLVRCMPNTPALVQKGATGLFANDRVSSEQKALAESLLNSVGESIWLASEQLLDSVTAVSGSGPAYFFMLMESMIDAGVKQGLTKEQATRLTLQTAEGAAILAQRSDVDVAELRRRVTSPGGTTEQAIATFEKQGFASMVDEAMQACAQRAVTLAEEFN